jgi:hypothetical protein
LYLTRTEREAVRNTTSLEDDPEELVKQALTAVISGETEQAAYSVAEAAGIVWVTPHIWHKEKKQVNAVQARKLLTQGKKDGTFDSPIPEDDAKALSEAEELREMAQTAWDQHVRPPEVEKILKMVEEFGNDDSEPVEEAPPEELPQEEVPLPKEDGQEDLSQIEPWGGYDNEKVSDIISGINAATKDYTEEDLTDLMANVWAYEAAHKNRSTILNHLDEVAKRLQAGEEVYRQIDGDVKEPTVEREQEIAEGKPDQEEEPVEPPKEEPPVEEKPKFDPVKEEVEGQEKPKPARKKKPVEIGPLPEEPTIKKPREIEIAGSRSGDSQQSGDPDYDRLMEQVEDELKRDRLHTPQEPGEPVPDLPWDWTKMSDKELQTFYGIYSASAYFKGYQLSREERLALHCKQAADELHNTLLVALEKYDEHGKEKKVALVEAEVETDENVRKWRRRQRKHETFAANHKNERDSLGKIVEALSRHESMRHQEWERSGGKVGKR